LWVLAEAGDAGASTTTDVSASVRIETQEFSRATAKG
jgi:hypothetical protein